MWLKCDTKSKVNEKCKIINNNEINSNNESINNNQTNKNHKTFITIKIIKWCKYHRTWKS